MPIRRDLDLVPVDPGRLFVDQVKRHEGLISKSSAPSFRWRETCEGWTLLESESLHVLQERMPPGTSELLHLHDRVRQLYFVLEGEATVDLDGISQRVGIGEALRIEPGVAHRMTNRSAAALEFLVISSSAPRKDRHDLE